MSENKKFKIGITLSGGGVRGVLHLGALKALEERGIRPEIMSGVSAGAIISALYAHGYAPDKILTLLLQYKPLLFLRPSMTLKGLSNMAKIESILKEYLPENTFESLTMPLYISAMDLKTGDTKYFSKGELIQPILASACLPVIFQPIVIDGHTYIDGGMTNNLPTEIIRPACDFLIGIHTNPIGEDFQVRSMKSVMERLFLIIGAKNVALRRQDCDWYIEPPEMGNFAAFDYTKITEIYDIGYSFTKSFLNAQNTEILNKIATM
ncbi:MAG: patatin-like phospholipase family protein [Bernardetiaceae bacterium]|nr:patatin-like phospholipase family protein [Bernardetiaceae bacterium]